MAKKRGLQLRVRPSAGSGVVWPLGVQQHFGITAVTRWRWERAGKLPARDVYLDGQAIGWRRETLDRAEAGPNAAATTA